MTNVPEAYLGVWHRRLLSLSNGLEDVSTQVYWLQTPQIFGDLRIPEALFTTEIHQLNVNSARLIVETAGFAGTTEVRGDTCQWHRQIDFQPAGGPADIGRMTFETANRLREDALDGSYYEIWERLPESIGPTWALALKAADNPERKAFLMVAGDCFLFAADRPELRLYGGHLRDHLTSNPEPLLAFEISFGWHNQGVTPWRIALSTVLGRIGEALLPPGCPLHVPPATDTLLLGRYQPKGGWQPLSFESAT